MATRILTILAITVLLISSWGQLLHARETQAMAWPTPETENRPGSYWWWMGSAVDKENITWNMETMRKNGMGGGTIVPIYGVKGYEDRFIEHISPKFIDMMSHAAKEAERLGMWVDMTPGTGWPFGGPFVTEDWCDTRAKLDKDNKLTLFPGRRVKRAAPGGAGLCIDPYSPEAMRRYLTYFDKAFDREDITLPRAFYHDSFEFQGNWSRALPEEFKRRRGYDLMEHLPEVFGTSQDADPETMARVKSDYRETLADLHLEYIEVLEAWAKSKGRTTRNQAHGSPANLLDVYAASGIPETETFGATPFKIPGIRREADNVRPDYPQPLFNRMASSAAHVAGRQLVASESCTWLRNHFRAALSQAKPEVDQLLLNGINHICFHGTCYSPKEAPWPGWLFYASFEYNPRNAIWRDAKFLNEYITRCQSILQAGSPDNDVALYWPIYDNWHDSDPKKMQMMLTVHHTDWLSGPRFRKRSPRSTSFCSMASIIFFFTALATARKKLPGPVGFFMPPLNTTHAMRSGAMPNS